ncbi:hypothetical protein CCR75_001767 [Bremia lactucae]|uniref:Uncharacterized protein n=1 Tax=Bremia lactucae TaxID=4779 RepID=A0A976IH56_BRELC|nr:hypothetical protein CCR75_001767 [Bremia lactucae]
MWLLDSGDSSHMTFDRDDYCTPQSVQYCLEVFVASSYHIVAKFASLLLSLVELAKLKHTAFSNVATS